MILALTAITFFQPFTLLFLDDYLGMTVEGLEPGCRQLDWRVEVVQEELEGDREVAGDLRIARFLLDIANSELVL